MKNIVDGLSMIPLNELLWARENAADEFAICSQ